MKNLLKKYLRDGKEGFSLVELIIVIAIMAVLVGVVSLAVIPYLEKSKESKDLQTLDTICTALTTAVADTKITGDGTFEYTTTAPAATKTNNDKLLKAMQETIGKGSIAMQSTLAAASGNKIACYYNTSDNSIYVCVTTAIVDKTKPTAVASKYNANFEVSN